jgi:hypothetical protein
MHCVLQIAFPSSFVGGAVEEKDWEDVVIITYDISGRGAALMYPGIFERLGGSEVG